MVLSKKYRYQTRKELYEYSDSLKDWVETAESMSPPEKGQSLIRELRDLLSKFDKAVSKRHYKKACEITWTIDYKWSKLWHILQRMRGTQHARPK